MTDKLYKNHPEYKVLGVIESFTHIIDELIEFLAKPSLDELSDVSYAINRFLGSLSRRKYVDFLPAKLHILKCNKRFEEYGHFRSKTHLND